MDRQWSPGLDIDTYQPEEPMARGTPPSNDPSWIRCDARDLDDPDLRTIDELARLALLGRRTGRRVLVVHPPPALRALVAFAGLGDVLWFEEPTDEPPDPADPAVRTPGTDAPCPGRT